MEVAFGPATSSVRGLGPRASCPGGEGDASAKAVGWVSSSSSRLRILRRGQQRGERSRQVGSEFGRLRDDDDGGGFRSREGESVRGFIVSDGSLL